MAAQPLAEQVGIVPACRSLGVSRATFYRRQRSTPGHQQPRPTPARALCEAEREQVLDELASPRFVDRAPAEVVATLLDEGRYLCSERTMYRILAADQPVRERRNPYGSRAPTLVGEAGVIRRLRASLLMVSRPWTSTMGPQVIEQPTLVCPMVKDPRAAFGDHVQVAEWTLPPTSWKGLRPLTTDNRKSPR